MLVFLSFLLVALGLLLNRLCNRFFQRHREQFACNAKTRRFKAVVWLAVRKYPPMIFAIFGYLLGIYMVIYGLLILID